MFTSKYHLPHNAVRPDEFEFLLDTIDTNRKYYLYDELLTLFLCEEVRCGKFEIFHRKPDARLKNHADGAVRAAYSALIKDPNAANARVLFDTQYTERKTFKRIWNEFVRDYTEFFAFLGLLPTYYKGKGDAGKKHYVTERLKDYKSGMLTARELFFGFKYRNASKNQESFEMYDIRVRPFVVALEAIKTFAERGYNIIDPHIVSAVTVYARSESEVPSLCDALGDPSDDLRSKTDVFPPSTCSKRDIAEIGRATLFLKPYLTALGIVRCERVGRADKYIPARLSRDDIPNKCVFCNGAVGELTLTPAIGRTLYACLRRSGRTAETVDRGELFDGSLAPADEKKVCEQLIALGVFREIDGARIEIAPRCDVCEIDPYTDFFTIEDADYVYGAEKAVAEIGRSVHVEHTDIDEDLAALESIAYGSDGALYERALFEILRRFRAFNGVTWYGAAASGKRISDIAFTVNVFDKTQKTILVIVECKSGGAVRGFDERKETDNAERVLDKFKGKFDGVWYWLADGNSLPSADAHGGYRANDGSKSLLQKLNDLQFNISEYARMPAIVTAFSYSALAAYLKYLYVNTQNSDTVTPFVAPIFWRWSKKFMNLQYVSVHREPFTDIETENKLNNLDGKEWLRFTRSWFAVNARARSSEEIRHPAKFPEELAENFIGFFTKSGQTVFDPFVGVGSTIVGAENCGRRGVGIELNPEFCDITESRITGADTLYRGDCRRIIPELDDESFDFILTSPPYWNMLKNQRGNSDSQHSERKDKGLGLYYSDDENDLGNIDDYDVFLDELTSIFVMCARKLKSKKYMVAVVQNFRNIDGEYKTFAWDLVDKLKDELDFCGEKIWVQDNKKLGIWGYKASFVPNIHHHYCLIFRKKD